MKKKKNNWHFKNKEASPYSPYKAQLCHLTTVTVGFGLGFLKLFLQVYFKTQNGNTLLSECPLTQEVFHMRSLSCSGMTI